MRTIVLALTIALVASQHVNLVPDLAGTQTYVYKYEALLFSGPHQEGLVRPGIKINSKVLIRAVAENMFLLKLSNPQLFEYSGIWPDTFAATKLTAELAAQLRIPIKFEYTNGEVGKVFAPSVVPTTVINLHRGILNIFQLNLKKSQNVYEVQEAGVQGICETQYLISEEEENNPIIVTKSRDLTSCHERILKDIGLAYIEKCTECQQRLTSLSGAATYSYIMKPTLNGVVFTEATVHEIHQFAPLKEIGDATQMETRQTLTFLEIVESPIFPISAEYLAHGSLQYEFSTETLWSPIQLMRISNPQAQIVDALNHLTTKKLEEVHEDLPLKYIQLIQLMRFASVDAIEGIWSQFKTRPNFRKWILDAIPAVGTQAALKFIKKMFFAGELSIPEFTQILVVAVHMVTGNLDTIKMYSDLALSHKVQETPVLREVAMLGYGTMIFRYCSGALECPLELLKPIHEIASKADTAEITLILKVLGNAGHPASIKYITKFLPVFGTKIPPFPMTVQVGAILALKAVTKKEPKLVQNVVLQIFVNKDLHPELRMLSWIVLLETKPSMGLVITLARALQKEPSLQVASFAYSHMKALTKIMAPDFAQIAAACNVAIKILSPKLDKLSFLFSKAFILDHYQSPLMVGAAGSVFFINDAATILPRAVVVKAYAYLAGASADVFEVGIRTDGIQETLLKHPFLNEDRQPRMKQVLEALKAFKALPNKQPLGSIYVKLLGQEVAFANIDKTILEQATQLTTGGHVAKLAGEALKAMQNGIAFQYAKPLLVAEVRRIFPSVAGVPMDFSLYTAAVAAANLKVQAIISPPLTDASSVAHLMKTDVRLTAEVSPSIALQTFAVMGLNTDFIHAAFMARGKLHTFFPLKVEAKIDIPNAHFKIQASPIVLPVHAVTARFETSAAVRNIKDVNAERITSIVPEKSSVMPLAEEPELRSSVPVHKTLCFVVPHIGVKACLEVMSCNAGFIKNTTLYNLIGQHGVHINIARADGPAVEGLELEVQLGPRAAKKLLKDISDVARKTTKVKAVQHKLRGILEGGQRNINDNVFNYNTFFFHSNTVSSSISSSSSDSSISHLSKAGFLGDPVPPVVAIIARVVRVDSKLLGYQLTAYLDRPNSRVQIIVVSIAVKDSWKMCADGVLIGKHKFVAKTTWGAECQKYAINFNVGTGHHGPSSMAYLKVKYEKVPTIFTTYMKSLAEYIPGAAQMTGLAIKDDKNIKRQISLVIHVPNERTMDIIIKTPTMTMSKSKLVLPIPLTLEGLQAYSKDNVLNMIHNLYIQASSVKCSKVGNSLTIFNRGKYNIDIPLSCYQVLVQDCTSEHKFIVLMKKDDVFKHEDLHIQVADIDVDLYHQESAMRIKMNGAEVPTDNISYQHPTGTIRIEQKGHGIALYAPGHGLQEVYYATDQWKIYVVDWMKGQTCGLCGKADGETRPEYSTPSGHLTKSSVSFAHSWVLHAKSCRDADQCRVMLDTVKLEKQKSNRQATKCYSVEPVLRCLPGCLPIRTSHVTVGYYCLPSTFKQNIFANLSRDKETEDLRETTEVHMACHCTEECV